MRGPGQEIPMSTVKQLLLDLNAGVKIGVHQVVWDPATLTLHVESDALLEQHALYGVIVTNRLLDAGGAPVQMAQEFRTYPSSETTPHWYKKDLDDAIRAAFDAGVQR